MKKKLLIVCFLSPIVGVQALDVDHELAYCHQQVLRALEQMKPYDYSMQPRNILSTDTHGRWNCRKASGWEWCSGFWPGILWMDYMATGDKRVKKAAEGFTQGLANILTDPIVDHDMGFLIHCSSGKGFEATGCEKYRRAILRASDSLATLFNPKVGTILSWPRHVKDYGGHNTIMDNMINLDMLLWASEHGGNPLLRDVAIMHATTTLRNHFRPDYSAYHVAVYDTLSGRFLRGMTHQGYSDSSMWARGQSWAIYGFTMMYRHTHDVIFLQQAMKVTDIYLQRLRETSNDWIPLWDMDDPRGHQGAPKDASAACVVASALLELSQFVVGEKSNRYHQVAINMLTDLSSERYQSRGRNVAFLLHSTGHHPAKSEIDASIIYADYYYLEALMRLKGLI